MNTIHSIGSVGYLLVTCVFLLVSADGLAEDSAEGGRTVRVSVVATDSSQGARLHYRWRSTDGLIADVNLSTTRWTLPPGPGLHYAYVLVSNGLGGYAERRLEVSTDDMPRSHERVGDFGEVSALAPPPAPAQVGDYMRGFVASGITQITQEIDHDVYAPGVLVYLQDSKYPNARYPISGSVATNIRGEFIVPEVPLATEKSGHAYDVKCSIDGGFTYQACVPSSSIAVMLDTATPNFPDVFVGQFGGDSISGTFLLADKSPCGVNDEFFGVHSNATAALLDANNRRLAGPVLVNEFGDFSLPYFAKASSISLRCEGATMPAQNAHLAAGDGGLTMLTGVSAPMITDMSATWKGKSVGTFLPPPTSSDAAHPFASDILTRSDGYLASKGIDSRKSACQYYKAVGAVQGCDRSGHFTGAVLTYAAWQRQQEIGPYAKPRVAQYGAAFVNRADLNLARQHTSISYGPNDTAAVVCNHLGPPATTPDQLLNPARSDIDTAVLNAVDGKNLVACVAMDYHAYPGVNEGSPFVRFLIFGPSGQLLPSVNLDGRAEKFVPGTCVVCHGGDHYQGKFPEDGSGFANIGGHFLPYDTGNFDFLSPQAAQASGLALQQADQEESIYHLNQNVRWTGPTAAEVELIDGWYKTSHVLDQKYLPDSWQGLDQTHSDFYRHVIARACRTCHAAMIEAYNFDHEKNIDQDMHTSPLFQIDPDNDFHRAICGGHEEFAREHMMPNSLVTFNRLWASDQLGYLNNYLDGFACDPKPTPD
jgi:hypothetical protein